MQNLNAIHTYYKTHYPNLSEDNLTYYSQLTDSILSLLQHQVADSTFTNGYLDIGSIIRTKPTDVSDNILVLIFNVPDYIIDRPGLLNIALFDYLGEGVENYSYIVSNDTYIITLDGSY